jgi:hypothetical protein
MLGPGRQLIGRAHHDLIMLRPIRHGLWPLRPAMQRHDPARPAWPDSSRSLTSMDPTAGNLLTLCIKPHPNPTWPQCLTPHSPVPTVSRCAHPNPTAAAAGSSRAVVPCRPLARHTWRPGALDNACTRCTGQCTRLDSFVM